jgi:hypothetical protein
MDRPLAGEPDPSTQDLLARLSALAGDLEAGRYIPGPWKELLSEVRRLPRPARLALAESISRLSEQLHARTRVHTVPFWAGLLAEVLLALLGATLLWLALEYDSNWAAVSASLLWTMCFQPLLKIVTGTVLGIRYAYAYLLGPEPRFKMRFGSYIAASRAARILFHLSGTLGSPLGAWLPTRFLGPSLRSASTFCWILVAVVATINVVPFALALAGMQRIGPIRLSLGSAASAALEIREALGK